MPDNSMVKIHLRRAADLAIHLERASVAYLDTAMRIQRLLTTARADPTAPAHLGEIAGVLGEERARLQRVVDDVRAIESGLADPIDGLRVDHAPHHSPFATEAAANDAARDAYAAFERGDMNELARISALWDTEGAYAVALAKLLQPEQIADALARYDVSKRYAAGPGESRVTKAAMANLFQTLSVASRTQPTLPLLGPLADVIDRDAPDASATKYMALAPLFEPELQWSTEFLIDAGRRFLVPINRDVLAHGDVSLFRMARDGRDARVMYLEQLAGDPRAAQAVLHGRLDDLLPSKLDYADGGQAMGAVLLAGTSPDIGLGRARAQEVIDHIADHPDLQPEAHAVLGKLAAPYLGSFRDLGHKGVPIDDPLPQLNPQHGSAFLAYAASSLPARADLQSGLVSWADRELAAMAPRGYDATKLQVIGNVYGNVTEGRYRGGLHAAMTVDQANDDEQKALNAIVTILSDFMDFPFGSIATFSAGSVIAGAYPKDRLANIYAGDAPRTSALQQALLGTLVVQRLWQHREQNHVFDSDPPPSSLLTSGGRLKTYAELTDDTDRLAMRRWLNQLEASGKVRLGSVHQGFADAALGF